MGCTIGVPPATASTYTGLIATNDFTCAQSGNVSLPHGEGISDLVEIVGTTHSEAGVAETLTITCGARPTPTVAPTATAMPGLVPSGSAGTLSQTDGSGSAALWLAIGSLLTLAAGGFAVFGWRVARSR